MGVLVIVGVFDGGVPVTVAVGVSVEVGVEVQALPLISTQGVGVFVGAHGAGTHTVAVGVLVGVYVNVGVSVGWQPGAPGWQVGVGVGVHGKPRVSTQGVGVSVGHTTGPLGSQVGVGVGWQPGVPGWQVGVGVGVQGKPSRVNAGCGCVGRSVSRSVGGLTTNRSRLAGRRGRGCARQSVRIDTRCGRVGRYARCRHAGSGSGRVGGIARHGAVRVAGGRGCRGIGWRA